jgi:hypothetical protein
MAPSQTAAKAPLTAESAVIPAAGNSISSVLASVLQDKIGYA